MENFIILSLATFSSLSIYFLINSRKLIYSVIFLAIYFSLISSIYSLMGAILLAILNFLIFVGGIVILILMTIMVSSESEEEIKNFRMKNLKVLLTVLFFSFLITIFYINKYPITYNLPITSNFIKNFIDNYSLLLVSSIIILSVAFIASLEYLK